MKSIVMAVLSLSFLCTSAQAEFGSAALAKADEHFAEHFDVEKEPIAVVGQTLLATGEIALAALVSPKLRRGFMALGTSIQVEKIKGQSLGFLARSRNNVGKTIKGVVRVATVVGITYVVAEVGGRLYVWNHLDKDPGFSPVLVMSKAALGDLSENISEAFVAGQFQLLDGLVAMDETIEVAADQMNVVIDDTVDYLSEAQEEIVVEFSTTDEKEKKTN